MGNDKTVPMSKYRTDVKAAERQGFSDGLDAGRQEIIDWLEHSYLHDQGRPDRGTPKAEAMLELARDAYKHFSKKRR